MTALLTAALLCAAAYRIALVGVAENFSRSDPERALQLSPRLPVALRARAEQLRRASPRDSAQIQTLLRESLAADPVEGRSFGLLGLEAALHGRQAEADRLLDAGIRRAPRDMELRIAAISKSLRDNRLEDAVRHILAALRIGPDRAGEYSRVHQYIGWLWQIYSGSAEGREIVKRMALAQSGWREAFLTHAAAYAAPDQALHLMGELKRRELAPAASEYNAVVRTLLSRREWRAAFALWMQHPARADDRTIPNLYNGDFSKAPEGSPGFDWQLMQAAGTRVALENIAGTQRHLRVDFVPPHTASGVLARHLLLLGPGSYELRARVRAEASERDRVPVLSLSCLHSAGSNPMVEMKLDDSNSRWREYFVAVQVPAENCAAQELDLRVDPSPGVAKAGAGSLWLDDVSIVRSRGHRRSGTAN